MRQQQMIGLINSLPKLTHHQRQQLAAALGLLSARSQASEVIEAGMGEHPACQHCHSTVVVKNGIGQRAAALQGPPVRSQLQRLDRNAPGKAASER